MSISASADDKDHDYNTRPLGVRKEKTLLLPFSLVNRGVQGFKKGLDSPSSGFFIKAGCYLGFRTLTPLAAVSNLISLITSIAANILAFLPATCSEGAKTFRASCFEHSQVSWNLFKFNLDNLFFYELNKVFSIPEDKQGEHKRSWKNEYLNTLITESDIESEEESDDDDPRNLSLWL
jgi:hypothetical protein